MLIFVYSVGSALVVVVVVVVVIVVCSADAHVVGEIESGRSKARN